MNQEAAFKVLNRRLTKAGVRRSPQAIRRDVEAVLKAAFSEEPRSKWQLYLTSHGTVHVADNPLKMACGGKLTRPATLLGDKVEERGWHGLTVDDGRVTQCWQGCKFSQRVPNTYLVVDLDRYEYLGVG